MNNKTALITPGRISERTLLNRLIELKEEILPFRKIWLLAGHLESQDLPRWLANRIKHYSFSDDVDCDCHITIVSDAIYSLIYPTFSDTSKLTKEDYIYQKLHNRRLPRYTMENRDSNFLWDLITCIYLWTGTLISMDQTFQSFLQQRYLGRELQITPAFLKLTTKTCNSGFSLEKYILVGAHPFYPDYFQWFRRACGGTPLKIILYK